jgi:ABC-type antimicrobial peptide transport system permease subunit
MYNKVHLCNRDLLMTKHIGYYALLKLITLILIVLLIVVRYEYKVYYFYALVITFLTSLEHLIYSIVQDRKDKEY